MNNCYHCGQAVAENIDLTARVFGEERRMCCVGCQAVTNAIVQSGSESFYQYRSDTNTTPDFTLDNLPATVRQELTLFDNPDVLGDIATARGEQFETVLIIDGITCAACGWLIEKQLMRFEGVKAVQLNLSQHKLYITWQQDVTALSDIISRIYSLGFKAQPYTPDAAQQQLQAEQKKAIQRLVLAALGTMQAMMFAVPLYADDWAGIFIKFETYFRFAGLAITTPVILYSARPFFTAFIRDLKTRHLTMDVPVSIAIGGAYLASVYSTFTHGEEVYFDSVCMFTFFLLVGRFLETRARLRNGEAGNELHNLMPRACVKILDNGDEALLPINQINIGDCIRIVPGSTIAADGIIVNGSSSIDESIITGEFIPLHKQVNDTVIAGSLNVENPIDIRVTAMGKDTQISTIMSLLDRAAQDKPKIAQLADTLAQYFVAGVLIMSVIVFTTWYFIDSDRAFWITLSVLVATCPCALSLATPTALTAATTALRRNGVLITRGHVLETLRKSRRIIFDKTGTLTLGQLTIEETIIVSEVNTNPLQIAASLEHFSQHPIAHAFQYEPILKASGIHNHAGEGLSGIINNIEYKIGIASFVSNEHINAIAPDKRHWVALADNKQVLAWFLLSDEIRPNAKNTISALSQLTLECELLSGDQSTHVSHVANTLGINKYHGGVSPQGKLDYLAKQDPNDVSIMVGDGINDVPVLAQAPVSIAIGSASDLAKTHADVILVNNQLTRLPQLIKQAHKTARIIKQNLAWALLYNSSVLPLAALGLLPPYLAAIGMSASSLVVVFNALRLNKLPK
ncbi:heavy metal translocating P-type ATPase [Bermanella sp. WJH001]|uniref:heavy metal translocating P-type ATPase n=1 Tax=Bermanella sp. WJH001 TaxID=3048005 RepID=UPI0024BED2DA|nr:heavy metal translocating P-type ATPase [Bermanella sp. WJH001]MDJ1536636.1 heavy metal translocating P-type ATPase [Bermanella sp. WJH001]